MWGGCLECSKAQNSLSPANCSCVGSVVPGRYVSWLYALVWEQSMATWVLQVLRKVTPGSRGKKLQSKCQHYLIGPRGIDLGIDSNAQEVAQNSRTSICACMSKYASLYWISLSKTLDIFGFVSWLQQCCGVNPSCGFISYPWGLVCREFLLQWSAQGP